MLSDAFFTVNYSICIISSIVGLVLCCLTILIIITHRQLRIVTNVLSCNTCTAVALYFIFRIITSIYGLREDYKTYQPACVFRAYCTLALCAALCYSYSIQAISRLFFSVFYQHKQLLTWRTHWILIIINWTISMLISFEPLFFQNSMDLEIESRSCTATPKIPAISIYLILVVYMIPLNTVTIVNGIIFHRVRQSTRRVKAAAPPSLTENVITTHVPLRYGRRELRLLKHMTIQSSIISLGGILYLVLVLWHITQTQSPPETFYLLSLNLITVFTAFMMIALFLLNREVRKIAFSYIRFRKV